MHPSESSWKELRSEMELDGIYVDKDVYSLWSTAIGTHQGGDAPGAPALPGGAGHQAAFDRRQKRDNRLRTWLHMNIVMILISER